MTQAREMYFWKSLFSGAGLILLVVILVLVNVLFSNASVRWDATEEKAYSLSPGTLQVLSGLEDEVTIKLFYSASQSKLPIYVKTHAKRVQELLQEYVLESNGRIIFEQCDPQPDSDEEEWADIYGMEAKALQTGEKVYFGIIAYSKDREETIPFLDYSRDNLLEYDLTRMISQLSSEDKKTIGVLSTLPVQGQTRIPGMAPMPGAGEQPWYFISELKKNYNVVEVQPLAAEIDANIDLLVVLHPKMLRPETLYAIDRFIGSGKNAVIMVDPVATVDQTGRGVSSSSLETLFNAWGVEMNPQMAAVDMGQPTQVRNRFNVVEEDPSWITVRGDRLSKDDPITANLEEMLFPMPGAIKKLEACTLAFEPLVTTTGDAALMPSFDVTLGARSIKQQFESGKESLVLAARISGLFPSAFPDGPPQESKDLINEEDSDIDLEQARKESTVIVIADMDFIYDDICIAQMQTPFGFAMAVPRNDNMTMFANSCEMLTGSSALISIRSRGKTERPFTKVLELRNKAQKKWLAKEKELMEQADAARKRLTELEQNKDADQRFIMSPEQGDEIDKFKEQQREVERELKEVRKNLRSDIVSLGWLLKFVNVLLAPLLVSLAGILFAIHRQRRMKRD